MGGKELTDRPEVTGIQGAARADKHRITGISSAQTRKN